MKKLLLLLALSPLLFSCGEEKAPDTTVAQIDSAFAAQETLKKEMQAHRNTDTVKMTSMPPVLEGDLIFQINEDPLSLALQAATGSKYSNVGMIFIRPRDRLYMVLEVLDSVRVMPLTEWVARGKDNHVALLRLRDSNKILNEKRLEGLKRAARSYRHLPSDPYFSWGDDAMYSSELLWKVYHTGLKIDLCSTRSLGSFDLSKEPLKSSMQKKYGDKIPKTDEAVSPQDLFTSPKLEVIYER